MNNERARAVLAIYRPGLDDTCEPELAAALALSCQDVTLGRWLAEQQAAHEKLRVAFRGLPVPEDLPERIIAEFRPRKLLAMPRLPALLALAALLVLCVSLGSLWLGERENNSLTAYRLQMARVARQGYRMDYLTNDLQQLRQFITSHGPHGDYTLASPLEKLPGVGCRLFRWHSRPVSLLCLDQGGGQLVWLFVIQRAALTNPPVASTLLVAQVGKLATASWTLGDKTYLLAVLGDEARLRKFL